MNKIFGTIVLLLTLTAQNAAAQVGKMYITDQGGFYGGGSLIRANLDGTSQEVLIASLDAPGGISLDIASGHLYFADDCAIKRSNLDGGDLQVLLDTCVFGEAASGLALDLVARKIYWTQQGTGEIYRANFDGTPAQITASAEPFLNLLNRPNAIAVDPAGGKVYWTESLFGGSNHINRANLNGAPDTQSLFSIDGGHGLALHLANGRLYWTDLDIGFIGSANLDGTDVQSVYTAATFPVGIAVDAVSSELYFIDGSFAGDDVKRVSSDGNGVAILIEGLSFGSGIALSYCGDWVVHEGSEQCDDGNRNDGDGCSASCLVEKDFRVCAEAVQKAKLTFMDKALNALRTCKEGINKGKLVIAPSACLSEAKASAAIAKAGEALRKTVAADNKPKCDNVAIAALPFCASSVDGLIAPDGQSGCLRQGALDSALNLSGVAYGGVPVTKGEQVCQSKVGTSSRTYSKQLGSQLRKCEVSKLKGKLPPLTDCQSEAAEKMSKAATKLADGIGKKCSDSTVSDLGICGETTVEAVVECLTEHHLLEVLDMF